MKQTMAFRSHRQSADMVGKKLNKTVMNDMITPRNKKLIPKLSMLRKLPSDEHEGGQSTTYRRMRGVSRKDTDPCIFGKTEMLSSKRSDSVTKGLVLKSEANESKYVTEETELREVLKETTVNHTVEDCTFTSKMQQSVKEPCNEENFNLTDESGIPNQVYTRRQRRVR